MHEFSSDVDVTQGGLNKPSHNKLQILGPNGNGVVPMLESYATVLCLPTYITKL